ncbi:KAP family P-loop NTPase fold protein [Leeuwenhoekiella palythoae]|uniref:KAP family P-loop NTPase fold protein n=1 Tax=Leeuwenhoekiella palythoae TaxID=573501 RepID=UPI0035172870|tara:strand:- start:3432 stop:5297 length:1866 start_codon:yes stop_codon:yes gene_type:complete
MWSDNETTEDLLGFKVHSDLISEVINDAELLPITMGVFGDWGSGKSSILKILSDQLRQEEDGTFVLYFNGWLFEGYDDAKAALLESIIKEFEENKRFGPEIKQKAKKLIKSVNWMRILGLSFKNIALPVADAYLTGGVSILPFLAGKLAKIDNSDIVEKLKGDEAEDFLKSLVKEVPEEDPSMLVREFRENFKELIEESKISKLVIIIDDLDRCQPDRIIENLEAIKLFLNVDNTAFIIGADPRIVRDAISHRFKVRDVEQGTGNRIVNDYLEKLIQVPYNLPKLSDSEVETYISLLICKRELTTEAFQKVLKAFYAFRETDRYSVFGLANIKDVIGPDDYENLSKSLGSLPALSSIITQSLYGNPRQIKRFLNTFILRNRLAKVANISGFDESVLAKLMILEYTERPLFLKLYEWQSTKDGRPNQILELEAKCSESSETDFREFLNSNDYSNWNKDKVVKWFKVEPALSEIDLRDYFWISRDNISSTIAGASLIPPIVKSTYNKLNQEGLPVKAAKAIIKKDVKLLNESELNQFFEFAATMAQKNQENTISYKLFQYMIEEGISGSEESYKFLLNLVDLDRVPPAIGVDLRSYKDNPVLGDFLSELFSKSKSKAAKAFNK